MKDNLVAFGLVFNFKQMLRLDAFFHAHDISIGGEGTGMSGYELVTEKENLERVLEAIRTEQELKGVEVRYYDSPEDFRARSKYDRLADAIARPDPKRPPLTGIEVSEAGVKGITQ